ncbi:hypothetical protein RJ641_007634 [Dillenia turbinata]|uniref:ARMC9 CTLH-like domain-containing protein n=1 Tax=Dillenia turbinata TaxID=194707 RepID=A0AAN8V1L1_9MAGN
MIEEDRALSDETKATWLVISYLIIQTLLISVSNSIFTCLHWWILLLLSVSSATLFFVLFFKEIANYMNIQSGLDQKVPVKLRLSRRIAYLSMIVSALVWFGLVMVYACYAFPSDCDHAVVYPRKDKIVERYGICGHDLIHRGQDWAPWFGIPYLKNPSLEPLFRVYFSKEWFDTLHLSMNNFLCEIFNGSHICLLGFFLFPGLCHFQFGLNSNTVLISREWRHH